MELRRLIGWGGCAVWLMVGLPIFLHGAIETWRLVWWSVAYLAFGGALRAAVRTGRLWWTAVQAASVIALVLLLCDGFEGGLLVLVAVPLGGRSSRRGRLTPIAPQSAALFAPLPVPWNPKPALLLPPAPPRLPIP